MYLARQMTAMSLPQIGEACIRREAWVLRCEGDGVAATGCIVLQNLDAGGFYSAYLRRSDTSG